MPGSEAVPIKVLCVVEMADSHQAKIRAVSDRVDLCVAPIQEMESRLADAEILYTRAASFEMDIAPRLRWVQLASASVDRLFGKPIMRSSVLITSASGIHATPVAEYVFASILYFSRRFAELARLRAARWMLPQQDGSSGSQTAWAWGANVLAEELRGKTMGVLGYGSVGREVARLADAFGIRVLAVKRSPSRLRDEGYRTLGVGDPDGSIPQRVVGPDRMLGILPECHFVVCCLPLTAKTEGIVGHRAFAAMRSDAYFVNVGRGRVVRESALVDALRNGRISGAALDVFETEPLPPDSPLFGLPNVILTPHIAPVTPAYYDRATGLFVENLRRYVASEPLLNQVDKQLGY